MVLELYISIIIIMFSTHSSVLSIVLPVNIILSLLYNSHGLLKGAAHMEVKESLPLLVVCIMLSILSLRRSGKNSVQTLSGIKRNMEEIRLHIALQIEPHTPTTLTSSDS